MTLAYGNAAYLLAKTGRSGLLTRVGADEISDHPVKIDMQYLNDEKYQLIDWLRKVKW